MKQKFKRMVYLVLSAVMILGVITGCGGQNEDITETTEGVKESKSNKITIELLTWHGPDSATQFYDGYEMIAKDYMETHDNVEIKIRYEADATYGSILETGFASDTAPDIIQMKSAQRSTYKMNIMNLREALSKKSEYALEYETWADSFVGGIDAFPVEDGGSETNAILFIPNDGNPEVYTGRIYIYNKQLIMDAGLDPEKTPANWTELFAWLEVLNESDNIAPIAGDSDLGSKVSQIGGLFGEDYADKFFEGDVNDPEFSDDLFWDKVYVLTCYDKGEGMPLDSLPYYPALFGLMKQHISYYQISWTENSKETEILTFANAKAAMLTTTFWDYDMLVSSLTESKFPEGYGIFQVPYLGMDTLDYAVEKEWITREEADAAAPYVVTRARDGGGSGRHDYGFCVNNQISDDEEKLAAVIDFLQFMSCKEEQDKYVETANSLSPVKDVEIIDSMESFIVEEPAQGYASRTLGYYAIEWGKNDWPVTLIKYLNGEAQLQETIEKITEPVWAGDIPAPEVLQEYVDTAQAELDSADDEEKEVKERALRYALLRQELYTKYYYEMSGSLTEIN